MRTRRTRTKRWAKLDQRRLVSVADVRTQALEQYCLGVPTSSATLRERFTLRGAGLGNVTDAFDIEQRSGNSLSLRSGVLRARTS